MTTPVNRQPQIHPAARTVMFLPTTDRAKDPWTGAPIGSGPNFVDPSAIDENVALAPPEGKTPAQVYGELEGDAAVAELEQQLAELARQPTPQPQFSLTELFMLMTFAAVGLGIMRLLPPGVFAVVVGAVGFVAMWVTGHWQVRSRWMHVVVYTLLVLYVVGMIAALVRS